MKFLKLIILTLIIVSPIESFAGFLQIVNKTDEADFSITAPYDLRERQTHVQITNVYTENIIVHVQIFQHDRDCSELNFNDELTPNDTVVYNLDNIVRNNGSAVPINLLDDSNGYIVVTLDEGDGTFNEENLIPPLIGNVRIIDNTGYEYRVNMSGYRRPTPVINNAYANFNTVDNAKYSDVIGYSILFDETNDPLIRSTVFNFDDGVEYEIFVYDMDEEPLSCDSRNFACGKVMNYGINEDFPNSRDNNLLCPGGGLANPSGGFIYIVNNPLPNEEPLMNLVGFDIKSFGFIGLNNNNGTGSMDVWHGDLNNS